FANPASQHNPIQLGFVLSTYTNKISHCLMKCKSHFPYSFTFITILSSFLNSLSFGFTHWNLSQHFFTSFAQSLLNPPAKYTFCFPIVLIYKLQLFYIL